MPGRNHGLHGKCEQKSNILKPIILEKYETINYICKSIGYSINFSND